VFNSSFKTGQAAEPKRVYSSGEFVAASPHLSIRDSTNARSGMPAGGVLKRRTSYSRYASDV
jgi:hypothetical protein